MSTMRDAPYPSAPTDMPWRVARLESRVGHIETTIAAWTATIARMDERGAAVGEHLVGVQTSLDNLRTEQRERIDEVHRDLTEHLKVATEPLRRRMDRIGALAWSVLLTLVAALAELTVILITR